MRAVSLSLQPPSWRKRIGTLAWKSGTAFIRNTVSRATKDTPRQITWKRCACTGRHRCTAIRSPRCATPRAGPPERRKLHFLFFDGEGLRPLAIMPIARGTPSHQRFIEFSTPDCLLRIQPGNRSDSSSWTFARSLLENLLRRKGITACSQEVLGSLTWLFPAC